MGGPLGFRAAWLRRALLRLVLGRRFMHTLERNREAAARLDMALKELFER